MAGKRYNDLRTAVKKLEKEGFTLIPIVDLETDELVAIDPSLFDLSDLVELLDRGNRERSEISIYFGRELLTDEHYYPIDFDGVKARYFEVLEGETDEEYDNMMLDILKRNIDEHNSIIPDTEEVELYIGSLFVRLHKVWHEYKVRLQYRGNYILTSDELLDKLDDVLFDGMLFGDEECDCCCCNGENCDCEDEHECCCGHHHD